MPSTSKPIAIRKKAAEEAHVVVPWCKPPTFYYTGDNSVQKWSDIRVSKTGHHSGVTE